jgi:hypothetical protein
MLSARHLHRYISWHDDEEYFSLQDSGANWTLYTSQPVTMSICGPESYRTDNISYIRLDNSRDLLPNATELYKEVARGNQSGVYPPLWISMPNNPDSLLALFMSEFVSTNTSFINSNSNQSRIVSMYTVCTVSSFWWTGLTSYYISDLGELIQTGWSGRRDSIGHDKLKPITIDPRGITTLSTTSFAKDVQPRAPVIVSTFSAALSRVPSRFANPNDNPFLGPIDYGMVQGYNWDQIKGSASYTKFEVDAMVNGFGYGAADTSTRLALAVIAAYCLVTIVYVTYTIATGHTSIAWSSATELIVLALQSKDPNNLGHVSVGLDTMETFRRSVGIRAHTVAIADTGESSEKLELVFEHDEENKKRSLKKVERNKAY